MDSKQVYILQHKNSNSNRHNELLSSGSRHENVWGQWRYASAYVLSSELDGIHDSAVGPQEERPGGQTGEYVEWTPEP